MANYVYGAGMAGYSVPATEHSTITSWGRENETAAYENLVEKFAKPGALVACVSDSYNLWNVLENVWGGSLHEKVKQSGATIVIRPDSGNPRDVVMSTLAIMEKRVGMEVNTKGYKVLPSYYRIIQGDGVNPDSIVEILDVMMASGYSASNIAFGMGGALLQQVNRDTQKFAYKCSAAFMADGTTRAVFKDPVTDPGKMSKQGPLDLIVNKQGEYQTVQRTSLTSHLSALQVVYDRGVITKNISFDAVRERALKALKESL